MKTVQPTYHAKTISLDRPLHSEDISEEDLRRAGASAWHQFEEDLLREIVARMGIPASCFNSTVRPRAEPDLETMKRAEPVPNPSNLLLQ